METIFSPSEWCQDIRDNIKGLQRGMICLFIMPHYQSISHPPPLPPYKGQCSKSMSVSVTALTEGKREGKNIT